MDESDSLRDRQYPIVQCSARGFFGNRMTFAPIGKEKSRGPGRRPYPRLRKPLISHGLRRREFIEPFFVDTFVDDLSEL